MILKLGKVECNQHDFQNFINLGFTASKKLRYLYIVTNNWDDPLLKDLNENFLPKLIYATENHEISLDNDSMMKFIIGVVEN